MDTTQQNEHEHNPEQETDLLIWDYLDGEISEQRCKRLSSMLMDRAEVRDRFVDAAVMNSMLYEHFRKQSQPALLDEQQADRDERPMRRLRRKHGRPPAA